MPAVLKNIWAYLSAGDLDIEYQQCLDEGKDVAPLKAEFDRVKALDLTQCEHQPAAEALLARTAALPASAPPAPRRPPCRR